MSNHDHRKLIPSMAALSAVLLASSMLAGCYAGPRVVRTTAVVEGPDGGVAVIRVAPPAPREEVIPRAPGARFVWDPGHWTWNGGSYVWEAGHYVERPRAEASWVAGHWADRGNGWVWVQGHWG
jgi:hypothetical protein